MNQLRIGKLPHQCFMVLSVAECDVRVGIVRAVIGCPSYGDCAVQSTSTAEFESIESLIAGIQMSSDLVDVACQEDVGRQVWECRTGLHEHSVEGFVRRVCCACIPFRNFDFDVTEEVFYIWSQSRQVVSEIVIVFLYDFNLLLRNMSVLLALLSEFFGFRRVRLSHVVSVCSIRVTRVGSCR